MTLHRLNYIIQLKMKTFNMNIEIGQMIDWKFGISTRQVERITEHRYIIHDMSSGWVQATVTKKTLDKLSKGEKSLLTLNWK